MTPERRTGLPAAYLQAGTSSFTEFVADLSPDLLPGRRVLPAAAPEGVVAHGTTVVAASFDGGIVMAGDRRATLGNIIANRDIDKVFVTDEHSAVGIAGTAGLAVDVVKLFQVELEHFEKIEGARLSLEGKANRLATMIRGNLGLALQGLPVVPLFAGYDPGEGVGRIFSYDVTGGCYEQHDHHGVGSGAIFARGSLKKLWQPGLDAHEALRVVVEALYDAADDDAATGGPDLGRRLWPTCGVVAAQGAYLVPDETLAELVAAIVAARDGNPGGAR